MEDLVPSLLPMGGLDPALLFVGGYGGGWIPPSAPCRGSGRAGSNTILLPMDALWGGGYHCMGWIPLHGMHPGEVFLWKCVRCGRAKEGAWSGERTGWHSSGCGCRDALGRGAGRDGAAAALRGGCTDPEAGRNAWAAIGAVLHCLRRGVPFSLRCSAAFPAAETAGWGFFFPPPSLARAGINP